MSVYIPPVHIALSAEVCCVCSVNFAMDTNLMNLRRIDGKYFYCPNGHNQHYTETEITRLKRENQSLNSRLNWVKMDLQSEKYSHGATKGKLTKFKNRIAAGVCPCCNRTFANLARHMTGQHPDFKENADE